MAVSKRSRPERFEVAMGVNERRREIASRESPSPSIEIGVL